ncbi:hypothetical protein [Klebsiella aerogenes]|uniref:hypothetical protein n=1 Tax=Klebsiella aerogenes TaxID=548 RepID=UPI002E309883|nr:hypothetical protein [Klebsiella aerogenes]
MREPISLDQAEYKSGISTSLWEVIIELANKECSPVLLDLLSIACDFNQEVHRALVAELEAGNTK